MPLWSTPQEGKIREQLHALFTHHSLTTHCFLKDFSFYLGKGTEHAVPNPLQNALCTEHARAQIWGPLRGQDSAVTRE